MMVAFLHGFQMESFMRFYAAGARYVLKSELRRPGTGDAAAPRHRRAGGAGRRGRRRGARARIELAIVRFQEG